MVLLAWRSQVTPLQLEAAAHDESLDEESEVEQWRVSSQQDLPDGHN
jgi:hypothetical protein